MNLGAMFASRVVAASLLLLAAPCLGRGNDVPTSGEVESAAWTYILSAAAHMPESSPESFCKTALISIIKYFPDEKVRDRLMSVAQSPVVGQKLQWLPTMDDCNILLWYVRTADLVAKDDAPRYLRDMGLSSRLFATAPDEATVQEVLAFWTSATRAKILSHLDAAWVGHHVDHAQLTAERPTVDLAVYSACPYGIVAEEAMLETVLPLFGDKVEFTVRYIGMSRFDGPNGTAIDERYCAAAKKVFKVELGPTELNVCSMHGTGEANEDLRQMAVRELYGAETLHKYILAFNKLDCDVEKYDSCADKAAKQLDLDPKAIVAKAGERLQQYAAEMAEYEDTVGRKAVGPERPGLSSPTLIVNGLLGAVGALEPADYARRICYFFDEASRPAACAPELLGDLEAQAAKAAEEAASGKDDDKRGGRRVPKGGACLRSEVLPSTVPRPDMPPGWRHAGAAREAQPGTGARMLLAAVGAAGLPIALVAAVLGLRARTNSGASARSHPLV